MPAVNRFVITISSANDDQSEITLPEIDIGSHHHHHRHPSTKGVNDTFDGSARWGADSSLNSQSTAPQQPRRLTSKGRRSGEEETPPKPARRVPSRGESSDDGERHKGHPCFVPDKADANGIRGMPAATKTA